MKFRVTMKDPDGPYDCINDAAVASVDGTDDLDEYEREQLAEIRKEKLRDFTGQWLRYGEYAEIEFDTKEGTATLIKGDS